MYFILWSFSYFLEFWSFAFIMVLVFCNFCIKWCKGKNKYLKKYVWIFLLIVFLFIGYFEYYFRVEWNVLWILIIFRRLKKVF